MKLILLRHTAVAVPKGTIYGQADVALADSVEADLAKVHDSLADHCSSIYSSPLSRCRQLAESLASRYGVQPIWDARLMEMNFGDWENKRWHEIPQQQAKYWGQNWQTEPAPAGESFVDVFTRINGFQQDCLHHGEEETIMVVSHSGPLRCLCLQIHPEYQQWPRSKAFQIPLEYGGIIAFQFDRFEV